MIQIMGLMWYFNQNQSLNFGISLKSLQHGLSFLNLLEIFTVHLFFYKQSIFDPRPENCLSFSKKSPQKLFSICLVDGLLTSILNIQTF